MATDVPCIGVVGIRPRDEAAYRLASALVWPFAFVSTDDELVAAIESSRVIGLVLEVPTDGVRLRESYPSLSEMIRSTPCLLHFDATPRVLREVIDIAQTTHNMAAVIREPEVTSSQGFTRFRSILGKSAAQEVIRSCASEFPGWSRGVLVGLAVSCTSEMSVASLARLCRCSSRTLERKLRADRLPTAIRLLSWTRCLQFVWLCDVKNLSVKDAANMMTASPRELRRQCKRQCGRTLPQAVNAGFGEALNQFTDALRTATRESANDGTYISGSS